jgi:hypothetical protein
MDDNQQIYNFLKNLIVSYEEKKDKNIQLRTAINDFLNDNPINNNIQDVNDKKTYDIVQCTQCEKKIHPSALRRHFKSKHDTIPFPKELNFHIQNYQKNLRLRKKAKKDNQMKAKKTISSSSSEFDDNLNHYKKRKGETSDKTNENTKSEVDIDDAQIDNKVEVIESNDLTNETEESYNEYKEGYLLKEEDEDTDDEIIKNEKRKSTEESPNQQQRRIFYGPCIKTKFPIFDDFKLYLEKKGTKDTHGPVLTLKRYLAFRNIGESAKKVIKNMDLLLTNCHRIQAFVNDVRDQVGPSRVLTTCTDLSFVIQWRKEVARNLLVDSLDIRNGVIKTDQGVNVMEFTSSVDELESCKKLALKDRRQLPRNVEKIPEKEWIDDFSILREGVQKALNFIAVERYPGAILIRDTVIAYYLTHYQTKRRMSLQKLTLEDYENIKEKVKEKGFVLFASKDFKTSHIFFAEALPFDANDIRMFDFYLERSRRHLIKDSKCEYFFVTNNGSEMTKMSESTAKFFSKWSGIKNVSITRMRKAIGDFAIKNLSEEEQSAIAANTSHSLKTMQQYYCRSSTLAEKRFENAHSVFENNIAGKEVVIPSNLI